MKKSILLLLAISLIIIYPVNAQGGLLKKVTKSMTDELLGRPPEVDRGPEPSCACDKAIVAMDMGGKLQLDYTELTISISDDGRILAQHNGSKEYYIVQNGVTTGPIRPGDKRLAGFSDVDEGNETNRWANNQYISRSGEKYIITFGGKAYGPYAQIDKFVITKSKDKFAALVVENIVVTEDQGKKMDEAIKNAKTDQEKLDIALKYSQQITQSMMQGGGPQNTMPKVVTNITGSTFDPLLGGTFDGKMKYDDILVNKYDKITDMQGKTVIDISTASMGAVQIFVNSDNSKYALYDYGSLTFSDKTKLAELFNPYLVKENEQVFLAYMYYSPKKNAIMQCKIAF